MKKLFQRIKSMISKEIERTELVIYPKGARLPYTEDTIIDVEYTEIS